MRRRNRASSTNGRRSILSAFVTAALVFFACFLLPLFHVRTIVRRPTDAIPDLSRKADRIRAPEFRILHIVTSLERKRLQRPLILTLQNTVNSILQQNDDESVTKVWTVDVYVILGYQLRNGERQRFVDALPDGVGLEVWDDATPLAFGFQKHRLNRLVERLPALARQHRFVVRDKINEYDFFSAWEDDMVVTADHIKTFLSMSHEINRLQENQLGSKRDALPTHQMNDPTKTYTNALNELQIKRLIPGFIRVEVRNSNTTGPDKSLGADAVDNYIEVKPGICCSFFNTLVKSEVPLVDLKADQIVVWETDSVALGLRFIPDSSLGWVALLPSGIPPNKNAAIDSFLFGNDYPGEENKEEMKRPGHDDPMYFAQQAGWMMSRQQLLHFEKYCSPKTFLPPFDRPHWKDDGLRPWNNNVEFWSGGFHLFDKCNVQRILSLDPSVFSGQLVFHGANNKHTYINQDRIVRANDILTKLTAARVAAEREE